MLQEASEKPWTIFCIQLSLGIFSVVFYCGRWLWFCKLSYIGIESFRAKVSIRNNIFISGVANY